MSIARSTIIALILLGLGSIATVRADGLAIRGTVKGTDGKALAGAQVRAEKVGVKGPAVVATTNAKGEYAFKGLGAGVYKVTAVVNKVPKSEASIRTTQKGWSVVDFDLSAKNKVARKKRMVWVSGETGTHIGSGHWEAVEDSTTGTGASASQRVDGAALSTQNVLGVGGQSGPGR
ncbi:MAG TPA: carboxypeptidase regulatory-like domain-containing protein [Chthoniobacterales bacterium]|nr:carboxypeptidase regulatory-like domain-containing protein [Chthoniobacterales bacterium]